MEFGGQGEWFDFWVGVGEVGEQAEEEVAACRVASKNQVGGAATFYFNEVAEQLGGLTELGRVLVFGGEVVCEEESRDVGAEGLLEVVDPEHVSGATGHDISAACIRRQ